MLQIIQQTILILGTTISAITDAKTGYIYNWITYPLLIIGFVLAIIRQQWLNIIASAIIFTTLYITYKFGKIGGGDVKIFSAIALLNPTGQVNFLLTTIFFASMSAMIFYSIYFTSKYYRKGINFNENKEGILRAMLFGTIIVIYFGIIIQMQTISMTNAGIMLVPILFGLVFLALQEGIKKHFFEQKILTKEIEEDEIITENQNEKAWKILKGKQLIGKKEKELLKKYKIKYIYVLRHLPPFGPFILLGVLVATWNPNLILIIFT